MLDLADTRPTEDEVLLRVAEVLAVRSTCSRLAVGAVLAQNGRIVSTGYNGAPPGLPHCEHYMDEPCERAVHAEANAILSAARLGITADDTTLYVTYSPCTRCAQFLIMSGVRAVHYRHPYRDSGGLALLKQADITCWQQLGEVVVS